MSINKNTMEVTRKITQAAHYWSSDQEEVEAYVRLQRNYLMTYLEVYNQIPLNEAFDYLNLRKSRDGLTLGWEYDKFMTKDDLFTWAFMPDGDVEVTFHNLKDITNLYKTEEELA